MKFFDTNFPNNYSRGLYDEKNKSLAPEHSKLIADVIFTATAMVLNASKSKANPVALKFTNEDESFVVAAVCQFFENEDKEQPGNWNLSFTFNEEDIPEGTNVLTMNNPMVHPFFRSVAGDKYHFIFNTTDAIVTLPNYFMIQLRKWLDENTKSSEEALIELDGVFQARGAIEGGEKVFAIEPAGEIKILIKDDAAIEK